MKLLEQVGLRGSLVIAINDLVVDEVHNLITDVGDEYYGERAAGIAGPPDQVTGMRLGTGSTAPSKTGAGAAIVTYLAGTAKAIDGGFPTSSQPGGAGTARRIQWKTSWAAGEADGAALREVVITNENPLTDVAGAAANTISRALFGPFTLGASDTISITWNHDLLGA
jgi:hypothetical protein